MEIPHDDAMCFCTPDAYPGDQFWTQQDLEIPSRFPILRQGAPEKDFVRHGTLP
jgi:hypothetical protein